MKYRLSHPHSGTGGVIVGREFWK